MKKQKEAEAEVDARLGAFTRSLQYVGTHSLSEHILKLVEEPLQHGAQLAVSPSSGTGKKNAQEGGRRESCRAEGEEYTHVPVRTVAELARELVLMWHHPGLAAYFLRWRRYTLLKMDARKEAEHNVGPLAVFAKDPRRRTLAELKRPAAYMQLLKFFQGFSPEALQQVARCVQLDEFEAGSYIITQGDPGDSFYVIVAGVAHVLLETGGKAFDRKKIIGKQAGDSFGEMALLQEGGRRSASVVAQKMVLCLQLTKRDFDIHIKHALERGVRAKMDVLCAVTLLRSCSLARLREMAMLLTEVNLDVSQEVIHQGREASAMYFILDGYADVYRAVTSEMEATKLHSVGPGDCFGEGVLLGKATHGVSIVTRTKLRALKLLRRDFTVRFLLAASRELGTRATRRGASEQAICRLVSKERAWAMYKKGLVSQVISNRIDQRFATEQAIRSARSQRRGADDARWPVPVNVEGWLDTDSICSLQTHFTAKERWEFFHAGCVLIARLTDASTPPSHVTPLATSGSSPGASSAYSAERHVAAAHGEKSGSPECATSRTVTFARSGSMSEVPWGGASARSRRAREREYADVGLLDMVFQEWGLCMASCDNFLAMRHRHDTLVVLSPSKEDIGDFSYNTAGAALELALSFRTKLHEQLELHNAKAANGRETRLFLHCAISIGPTFVKIGSLAQTGAKLLERIQGPNLEKACRLCDICLRSVPDNTVGGSLAVASLLDDYTFELLPCTDDHPEDRRPAVARKPSSRRPSLAHTTGEGILSSTSFKKANVPPNTPSSSHHPTPKPQTPSHDNNNNSSMDDNDPSRDIWVPTPSLSHLALSPFALPQAFPPSPSSHPPAYKREHGLAIHRRSTMTMGRAPSTSRLRWATVQDPGSPDLAQASRDLAVRRTLTLKERSMTQGTLPERTSPSLKRFASQPNRRRTIGSRCVSFAYATREPLDHATSPLDVMSSDTATSSHAATSSSAATSPTDPGAEGQEHWIQEEDSMSGHPITFTPAKYLPMLLGARQLSIAPSTFADPPPTLLHSRYPSPEPEPDLDPRPGTQERQPLKESSELLINHCHSELGMGWRPQTSPESMTTGWSFVHPEDLRPSPSAPTLGAAVRRAAHQTTFQRPGTSSPRARTAGTLSHLPSSSSLCDVRNPRGRWITSSRSSLGEAIRSGRIEAGLGRVGRNSLDGRGLPTKKKEGLLVREVHGEADGCVRSSSQIGKDTKRARNDGRLCLCNMHDPEQTALLWSPDFHGGKPPEEDWGKLVFVYRGRKE